MNEELKSAGSNTDINTLLERAFMFLEDGDFENANKYCEKVLDINPKNAEAYLGKLLVELKVKKQEDLKKLDEPFDNSSNYQKIIRFADEKLKSALIDYREHINARKENERLANIYNSAHSSMAKGNTEEAFKKAAALFESISGYKDADALAQECYEKAKIARVEKEEKSKKLAKKITVITAPIVCVLIAFILILNTVIIPASKYNDAIRLMELTLYTEAIAIFEELDGYNDSANKILEAKYDNAVALMNAGQLDKALNIFNELGDYKESIEKARNIRTTKAKQAMKVAKIGDYVEFGTYEQDGNTSNGKESIEWLVLDKKNGKILVISKDILDWKRYHSSKTEAMTWENCTLRTWLNETFINSTFSAEEKAAIPTVTVSADKSPYNNTDPGNATQDKIFLLSYSEVHRYFRSDNARQCLVTEYAYHEGASSYDTYYSWWLRSPGMWQMFADFVCYAGWVSSSNVVGSNGVRPAMWIDLSKIS